MQITAIINRIRAYRRFKDWTIFRLAKEAGLGESTIRRMDDHDWNPTRNILERLEAIIPGDFDEAADSEKTDASKSEAA